MVLWILPPVICFVYGALALFGFPSHGIPLASYLDYAVRTPACSHAGLGSSGSARRYSRNHCCFLFLRLLRCFSSPGSLPCTMYSCRGGRVFPGRVSPFRNPRLLGYVHLPAAYRSLSRLSSAPSAKASVLRPSSLDQHHFPSLQKIRKAIP